MLPPITFLGWIHTGCGIAAILIGAYALNKYKVISFSERASKIYLLPKYLGDLLYAQKINTFSHPENDNAHF